MTHALSLSYYTIPELTALEAVIVAAETGCKHVGLRLLGGQPGGGETSLLSDAATRRDIKTTMVNNGITPLDANTVRLISSSNVSAFLPFLDAAYELGAKHILTTANDPEPSRLRDNLCHICDLADQRSMTIDLEFVPWLCISNLAAAATLLESCHHQALGIAVDALHFHRSGGASKHLAQLPAKWFRYVQLCDITDDHLPQTEAEFIHEATKERLPPGEGIIDLVAVLRALPSELPVALEVPQAHLAQSEPAIDRVTRIVNRALHLLERCYDD